MSKTISAGRTPRIILENISGDLSLVGWEGEDILLKGDEDELTYEQDGDKVTISSEDDLSIRVPKNASVSIQRVEGDASIRGVMGGIELKEIVGDLSIRDVDSVAIDTIQSDFSLRGAKGNLSIKSAHSDVSIRDVDGNVSLDSVADDLALRDVRGNVSANVAEDVVLYLNPRPGNMYAITSGDDILLVMPPKANATLTLSADEIDIEWKGIINDDDATSRVLTLGDGSASITLSAGGDIRVTNQSNAGDTAEDFGNFAGIGMDWSGFGDRISRQVDQVTNRAIKQADESVNRAIKQADEALRRATTSRKRTEERVERKTRAALNVGRWSWDLSPKGVPMPPKQPSVSDEERVLILKMLQEKKITAEEADKLLSALEGGS
ncbi:MAG: hypothetical protein KA473_13890 [Anaerolineales bacterium]|nr:hypothetical protein [Anaerolineales bacterium]MBP6210521.1 hypothetical protein [Anaerolineales bacterium]